MPNYAPEAWKSQGAVLDAYAALHGVPQVELSRLLNEEYLVELGSAFPDDPDFPANPSNGNYRFKDVQVDQQEGGRWHLRAREVPRRRDGRHS